MTKDSQHGNRGVRIREASNPGSPSTRVRMEQEAEVALTGLEAAITRVDVWARVGDSLAATLLDSLGSDTWACSESCWGEMEDIGDDEVVNGV